MAETLSNDDWTTSEDSVVVGPKQRPVRAAPRPRTVIIVDDDRDTRELLQLALEQHGFVVSHAPSGLKLLSILHVDRPDLILLDVVMSWVNGFELCRAIKSNPAFVTIPICFISGKGDPASIRQGLDCGAAAYFVKPFDVRLLLARLDELLASPA